MKKAVIFALALLLIFVHPSLAQIFSIYTIPPNPHPGRITLVIQINSSVPLKDVTIHLTGLIDRTIYVEDVTSCQTEIPVNVNSGTHVVKAWISYTLNSTTYHEILEKVVKVTPLHRFEILGVFGTVAPGHTGNVTVFVKNCGETVKNVRVELEGFDYSSSRTVNLWREDQTISLTFSVYAPENESGVHTGQLLISYPEFGERVTERIPIGINFTGKPSLVLSEFSTTPARIYPNSNFTLRVGVENTGSDRAKGVTVRLLLPEGLKGENTAYLGDIPQNSEKVASFELSVMNVTGKLRVGVVVRCEKGKFESSGEIYVFPVSSHIDISGVYTIPDRPVAGKPFTLSVAVENSGKLKVRGVWIKLVMPPGFKGRDTYFIGSLDSGDSATSTFQIIAGGSGKYTFKAEIHYLDYAYRPHVKVEDFTVYVFSGSNYTLALLVIPVIAAIYLLRRYLKRA